VQRVVLGVCGGIAAYKAVELCRRMVARGLHVVPVLTDEAARFVGPLTFSALASEPVPLGLFEGTIPHTALGQSADVVVVAPATAHLLARYAAGMADDLLTATLLVTRAPVVVCPAMHTEMWEHPAVRRNIEVLEDRGVIVVPPESGPLAGGDSGPGRLATLEVIVAAVANAAAGSGGGGNGGRVAGASAAAARDAGGRQRNDLAGRRVLVSAGGTREAIDPVRYITNRSSGKQGHAIAEAAVLRGASVTLVTASNLPVDSAAIEVVPVDSAAEMEAAMRRCSPAADVIVMAAAVADFRPKVSAGTKIHTVPDLVLEATPDILAALVADRRPGQVLVGFAAETDDVLFRGRRKLERKGVDLMVVNDVTAPGVGFDHDTNAVLILEAGKDPVEVPLASKLEVADAILDRVMAR